MYSQKLIDEVKRLYPDWEEINDHAASGSVWLGRCLCDSLPNGIKPDRILSTNIFTLRSLKKEALLIKQKQQLYNDWCKEDPRTDY